MADLPQTPYRPTPEHVELPFSRTHRGLLGALPIATAALAVVTPTLWIAEGSGWRSFHLGGAGMFLLGFVGLLSGVASGALGSLVVRGKRTPAIVIVSLPILAVVVASALYTYAISQTTSAVSSESVDPWQMMRIVAEGVSEANVILIYGAFIAATGFGSAACALLGSVATIARGPKHKESARSAACIGIGIVALVLTMGLRVRFHLPLGPLIFIVPAMIVLTVLAALAARNATFLKSSPSDEAHSASGNLAAAIVAATAAVVLIDCGSLLHSESRMLSWFSGESVSPTVRGAMMIEELVDIRRGVEVTLVDGASMIALTLTSYASTKKRSRLPLGAALVVAALGILIVGVVRHRTFSEARKLAALAERGERYLSSKVDTPVVRSMDPYEWGEGGPDLFVFANGANENVDKVDPYQKTFTIVADRRAPWSAVDKTVKEVMAARLLRKLDPPMPILSIRVISQDIVDNRARAAPYDVFLAPPSGSVRVYSVEPSGRETKTIRPNEGDTVETVLQKIANLPPSDFHPAIVIPIGRR